eukprot:1559-Heterococcus_DN1.PRE.3
MSACECSLKYYNSHNVLIDDDGRALLTDFGLSKTESTISGSATTKSLFNGGTLAWTAPEIFNVVKGVNHQHSSRGLRPTPSVAAISENNVLRAELHEHLMQQGLLGDPTARPTFAELRTQVTA